MGSSPFLMSPSLTTSSISRKDISVLMSFAAYSAKWPASLAFFWRHTWRVRFRCFSIVGSSLVASGRQVDVLELQRLDVAEGRSAVTLMLPGGDVAVVLVVAQRFAVGGLPFLAEVGAAALASRERVAN